MKTAISIPDKTFEAAEEFAKARGMKRSELYKLAVEDYLERHQAPQVSDVTAAINKFLAENPEEEDPVLWQAVRRSMLKVEW